MRSTLLLLARNPPTERKIPLKPRMITEEKLLRDSTPKEKDGCLPQMTLLLTCLKTDTSGRFCKNELASLQSCYEAFQKKARQDKEERKREIPAVNAKTLTIQQTKYLLKKYPLV